MRYMKLICIVLFFLACAVPAVLLPFAEDTSENEKRELASFPSWRKEDGSFNLAWGNDFSSYVSDHFGLRSRLVRLDSRLKAFFFSQSATEDVIIGRDQWLFYSKTVSDYLGTEPLTARERFAIGRTLSLMQETVQANGAKFLFVCAPNKNSIYGDKMPAYYLAADPALANSNILLSELARCHVETVDLWTLFTASDQQLYHKRDSHWNNLGAVMAYNAMLDRLGVTHRTYADAVISAQNTWVGDLDTMLFPGREMLDVQYEYEVEFSFRWGRRFKSVEDMTVTATGEGTERLLMFRDSFGNAILPFLADAFSTSYFSRGIPYDLRHMETENATVVIVEIVERNLRNLLQYPAIMEAPQRFSVDHAAAEKGDTAFDVSLSFSNGLWLLEGMSDQALPEDAILYVVLNTPNGVEIREASPKGTAGFAAYLSEKPSFQGILMEYGHTVQRCDVHFSEVSEG